MAEAENVGYKRGKGRIKPMPNDLFDVEYSPLHLETSKVNQHFKDVETELKALIDEQQKIVEARQKKLDKSADNGAKNDKAEGDLEKERKKLDKLKTEHSKASSNKISVDKFLQEFYENDILKEEFHERDNQELTSMFKSGLLTAWKSEDVLLRKINKEKILDHFRQTVKWA